MAELWPEAEQYVNCYPPSAQGPIRRALATAGERLIMSTWRALAGTMTTVGTGRNLLASVGQILSPLIRHHDNDEVASALIAFTAGPTIAGYPHVSNWLLWCARWHQFGLPTVRLTSEQFAALAMTDVGDEHLIDLQSPWPAFAIALPEDAAPVTLVESESPFSTAAPQDAGVFSCQRIAVTKYIGNDLIEASPGNLGRCEPHWLIRHDVGPAMLWSGVRTAADLRSSQAFDTTESPGYVNCAELESRAIRLGNQVAINVALAIQTHGLRKERSGGSSKKCKAQFGLWDTKDFVLGTPVTIDMRPAVHAYLRGDSSRLAKSRWSVRGHWRNQRCGPGLSETKRLWIAPHWSGKPGAPMLVRDHLFSSKNPMVDPKEGAPDEADP